MYISIDEKNNKIYHHKPLNEIIVNSNISFEGSDNILYLGQNALIDKSYIRFAGSNALAFIADTHLVANLSLDFNCTFYSGNHNFFNFWMMSREIVVSELCNFIIGDDCLLSGPTRFETLDWHLIYDMNGKRINTGKSLFIGDHCWITREVSLMKGTQIFSGSIIGAKSIVTAKTYYSNAIYAGIPSVPVKKNIFWSGDCPFCWPKAKYKNYEIMSKDDFKFNFEKDKFLNPVLLDAKLKELENAQQKLEFVYDYIYNNTHKNRFALFEYSDTTGCKLYKDTSKISFRELKFTLIQENLNIISKPLPCILSFINSAVLRIQNHLAYRLGAAIITNSKNFKSLLTLPFKLYKIKKEFELEKKIYAINIKQNPALMTPDIKTCFDYKASLKEKECFTYKLGSAFLKGFKTWYKFGLVKFYFEAKRLEKEFKNSKK